MRLHVLPAARRRLVRAVVAAALAGPLLAGCSTLIPGQGGSATGSAAPAPAAPSRPPAQGGGSASAAACQVTVNGPGSIRVGGASSRVSTINGASSLTCGDGPVLAIGAVADGAVTLSTEGAAPVKIPAGQSAAVGSYQVTVSSADGAAAEFVVDPG